MGNTTDLVNFEKQILTDMRNSYKLTECDTSTWDTDKIKVIGASIGLQPNNIFYGKLIGSFEVQGRVFSFMYNVHTPNQGNSSLSNRMESLDETVFNKRHPEDIERVPADFGLKAFWMYTPIKTLKGDDLELRKLINNISSWSSREKLCKRLSKTDKLVK